MTEKTRKTLQAPRFPAQKPHHTGVVHVSLHELAHFDMAGVACVARRVRKGGYDDIIAHSDCSPDGGEAALEFRAGIKQSDPVIVEVAQLAAFGPIASVDDMATFVRNGEFDELAERGGLSDADKALCLAWSGPPLLPLTCLLAVRSIHERLGAGKMHVRAKALRDVDNQSVDALKLRDILPYERAAAAYEVGREQIKALMRE